MPGLDGIAFMEKARSAAPGAVFVVMTAFGTISSAVEAMKKGAENYLLKPLDPEALGAVVDRAMEKARLVQEAGACATGSANATPSVTSISADPKMQAVLDLVAQVGPSKASVLVTGESGTGKELIAEAIHWRQPARAGAVRAPPLRGAARVAPRERALRPRARRLHGRDRAARGALRAGRRRHALPRRDRRDLAGRQVKLLRFLQEKTFERVGGNETLKVDVRVVAATNRDLAAPRSRRAGSARTSSTASTSSPSSCRRCASGVATSPRSRASSCGGTRRRTGKPSRRSPTTRSRRSSSTAGRATCASSRTSSSARSCCATARESRRGTCPPSVVPAEERDGVPPIPGSTIAELERYAILRTLEACGGSTSKAATVLGVSPRKIQYKLHEYAFDPKGESASALALRRPIGESELVNRRRPARLGTGEALPASPSRARRVDGGERRDVRGARGRDLRLPRAQRRRQDHDHQDAHGPHRAERRADGDPRGPRAVAADDGPGRLSPGEPVRVPVPDAARVRELCGRLSGLGGRALRDSVGPGPRAGGHRLPHRPSRAHAVQGDAAARRRSRRRSCTTRSCSSWTSR